MGASSVTEPSPCEQLLTRGSKRRRGLPRGRGPVSPDASRYWRVPPRRLESSNSCTRRPPRRPPRKAGGSAAGLPPPSLLSDHQRV